MPVTEKERLRHVIGLLKRGSCWCGMGIGDPRLRSHTAACKLAQEVMR